MYCGKRLATKKLKDTRPKRNNLKRKIKIRRSDLGDFWPPQVNRWMRESNTGSNSGFLKKGNGLEFVFAFLKTFMMIC